jgi:hypothetical protein
MSDGYLGEEKDSWRSSVWIYMESIREHRDSECLFQHYREDIEGAWRFEQSFMDSYLGGSAEIEHGKSL